MSHTQSSGHLQTLRFADAVRTARRHDLGPVTTRRLLLGVFGELTERLEVGEDLGAPGPQQGPHAVPVARRKDGEASGPGAPEEARR